MVTVEGPFKQTARGMNAVTGWADTLEPSDLHDVEFMQGAFISLAVGLATMASKRGASSEDAGSVLGTLLATAIHRVYEEKEKEAG